MDGDDKKEREFLEMAIELGRKGAEAGDGGPFGALIVDSATGAVLSSAHNTVRRAADPTAHAEVNAVRLAAAARGESWLQGCTMYTSCQPCPMCYAACMWARIERIVYAASAEHAQAAAYDDSRFWAAVARVGGEQSHARHLPDGEPAPVLMRQTGDGGVVRRAADALVRHNQCKY